MLKLIDEVKKASKESKLDDSGMWMSSKQGSMLPDLKEYPEIRRIIGELEEMTLQPAKHLMINTLPAGIIVPIHRDFLPGRCQVTRRKWPILSRWHFPVISNSKCWFWDERSGKHGMGLGDWFGPIGYWKPHQVANEGDCERVHLIVDLAINEEVLNELIAQFGDYEENLAHENNDMKANAAALATLWPVILVPLVATYFIIGDLGKKS